MCSLPEVPIEVFRFQTLYTLHNTQQFLTLNAPRSRGGRRTGRTRRATHRFDLSPLISQLYIVDDRRDQPLQGESNFWDSSGPLFSIYSKAAEDEDNKMVDRWQKDADGILFFVRPCVCIHIYFHIDWDTIDRSILCRSRCTPCCDSPGPEAKQSGYLRILPWQHLSGSRRPERNTLIHPISCRPTTLILPIEIRRLGEYSLVLELGNEP
jgi:hypothetical protein